MAKKTVQLEMRTSERRDLKSCAQRWYWSQVEGLRPLRSANPLWFGTAIHEALAQWYIPGTVRGRHPVETFDEVLAGNRSMIVTNDDEEQEYVDARELGVDMLTRYLEHWGDEPWKNVIAPEYKGMAVFEREDRKMGPLILPGIRFNYHFTYDGVYIDERTDEIWLDEHKTAASIWHEQLPLDDQAGSYWAIASTILQRDGVLKKGQDIAGISYNFLRKSMGDDRPFILVDGTKMYVNKPTAKAHYIQVIGDNAPGEYEYTDLEKMTMVALAALCEENGWFAHGGVSASQPPPYFERFPVYRSHSERAVMIERIKDESVLAQGYREGWLPITKAPSLFTCRGCPFFKTICQMDEAGEYQSVEEMKDALFTTEDPYEAYHKVEE